MSFTSRYFLSRYAQTLLLFNQNHDEKGKFSSGSGVATMEFNPSHEDNLYPTVSGRQIDNSENTRTIDAYPSELTGNNPSKLKQLGTKALWLPYHVERAVKTGVKSAVNYVHQIATGEIRVDGVNLTAPTTSPETGISRLAGKTVGSVKFVGKTALKIAYSPWIAGAKAVEGIARAKGLSNEDAAKVRALVTCYDCVACKAVVAGLHAVGMPHLAGMSTLVPTASLAYIAASTARNPLIVAKAASVAIRRLAGKVKGSLGLSRAEDDARSSVGQLADAIKRHAGNDYYFALICQAIDQSDNMADAIDLADRAFAENPIPV